MLFTPFTLIFSVEFPFLMPFTFKLEVLEEEMILALLEFVYLLFINLALPRILILAHLPLLTTIFVLLNFGDVVTVNTQLLLKPFLLIAVIVVLPFCKAITTPCLLTFALFVFDEVQFLMLSILY